MIFKNLSILLTTLKWEKHVCRLQKMDIAQSVLFGIYVEFFNRGNQFNRTDDLSGFLSAGS